MAKELRRTGISVIGDVPWGLHFCHFYETTQDLLDILVPYFKAGLEDNEFCLWVVSNPELITVEGATEALQQAVPDLHRHISDENIEILNWRDWYLEENVFNLERVMSAWDAKLTQALAQGYDGIRVSGDTLWLAEKDRKDFRVYEKQVHDFITDRPMTVLCSYPLTKSGASEVLDVVQIHQFAIARRQGEWEVIQSPELIQARVEIKRLSEQLQRVEGRTLKPPLILRYVVAVLSVIVALIIAQILDIYLVPAPGMLFLCALMFSAWYGGLKPSLLAMALSLLAFKYYFVTPTHSLTVELREIPRLSVFTTLSFFVVSLSAAQRSAAGSLRHARDVLNETVNQLKRANEALRAEITDRKHAEALLHAKEQEFRAIVENAPDQIIRYDREFRRTYVNPAVAEAYGVQAEALTGKTIGSVIADTGLDVKEEELAQVRRRIATVFETGQSSAYELTWKTSLGRRYYSVRLFPELDLNGAVINVLGIARDITESKLAEEELKKEKEILEKVFVNIPVMIGFIGDDRGIKLVNPEWQRALGWTLKEIQEKDLDIFVEAYPDPLYRQKVLDFVAASTGEWVDLKIRVRDGRVIDATCAVVHLSDGTRIAIAQDITERKSAEERIRATSDHLRALSARLQSAKEEEDVRIAREIHDEMGSTLTSLRWELERFDKTVSGAEDWSQRQSLKAQIAEMMRLTDITIGSVRRIASELRPSILDDLGLAEAIQWQAEQFQTRAGVVCRCDCSLENLDFDPEQSTAIFRIFQEALTNVLRHARATLVEVVGHEDDGEFVLTISDNGRGITEEEKSGRLSLGILGMRERAHLIAGDLEITGISGQGTVVTVRVPISGKRESPKSTL
jgi:PAS domain S-box-containing protein